MTHHRGRKPPASATSKHDRIDQAAARAGLHLERYFTGVPKPAELLKAKAALDEAIALAIPVTDR